MDPFTIYKTVWTVDVCVKIPHIHKIGGKLFGGFCHDEGDIPVVTEIKNDPTKIFAEGILVKVDNPRNYGYAHRNARRYRNKYKKNKLNDVANSRYE